MEDAWQVEVFYDGECPLCNREIAMVRRFDRAGHIRLTDIAEPDFLEVDGKDYVALMDRIHGRLPDGSWIEGVEVFRRMYSALGLGWLAALTRWPGLSWLMNWSYGVFARNRLRWTGRCLDDRCQSRAAG